jgi:hypothetical protein
LADYQFLSSIITARHPLLGGAFGSVDGLNLPKRTSGDVEIENSDFNSWLHSSLCSNVLVFSPTG